MIDLDYDGSFPIDRLEPPEGTIFRKCTIQNWTPNNCRIAARRRCWHIIGQLPRNAQWVRGFSEQVSFGEPVNIEVIELQLCQAIITKKL